MRVIIVGCGRVGARVAADLDQRGETVTVIDTSARAFARLPQTFKGETVSGNGTDEDVMRSAGAEQADIVMALTEGDNRNVMAAQLAVEAFEVPRVIAKINDPVRAAAYAELGIATLCRTGLMVDAVNAHIGFPPSGLAGMVAASGQHPGGDHHPLPGSEIPESQETTPVAPGPGPATPGASMEA